MDSVDISDGFLYKGRTVCGHGRLEITLVDGVPTPTIMCGFNESFPNLYDVSIKGSSIAHYADLADAIADGDWEAAEYSAVAAVMCPPPVVTTERIRTVLSDYIGQIEYSLIDREEITLQTVLLNPSDGTYRRCLKRGIDPEIVLTPLADEIFEARVASLRRARLDEYQSADMVMVGKWSPSRSTYAKLDKTRRYYCGTSGPRMPKELDSFGLELNLYHPHVASSVVTGISDQGEFYLVMYVRKDYIDSMEYWKNPPYFRYHYDSYGGYLVKGFREGYAYMHGSFNVVSTRKLKWCSFPTSPSPYECPADVLFSPSYPEFAPLVLDGSEEMASFDREYVYDLKRPESFMNRQAFLASVKLGSRRRYEWSGRTPMSRVAAFRDRTMVTVLSLEGASVLYRHRFAEYELFHAPVVARGKRRKKWKQARVHALQVRVGKRVIDLDGKYFREQSTGRGKVIEIYDAEPDEPAYPVSCSVRTEFLPGAPHSVDLKQCLQFDRDYDILLSAGVTADQFIKSVHGLGLQSHVWQERVWESVHEYQDVCLEGAGGLFDDDAG